MKKWDYCAIGPLGPDLQPVRPDSFCEIWYLTGIGIQTPAQLNLPNFSQDPIQYSAQLIWLLGEEGWELAGSGTTNVALNAGSGELGHMLYFKRERQDANL